MTMEIQAPVRTTVTALGASAGSNAFAASVGTVQSFWPTTAVEWAAFGASGVAICYTCCVWGHWYWKNFVRKSSAKVVPQDDA